MLLSRFEGFLRFIGEIEVYRCGVFWGLFSFWVFVEGLELGLVLWVILGSGRG